MNRLARDWTRTRIFTNLGIFQTDASLSSRLVILHDPRVAQADPLTGSRGESVLWVACVH